MLKDLSFPPGDVRCERNQLCRGGDQIPGDVMGGLWVPPTSPAMDTPSPHPAFCTHCPNGSLLDIFYPKY